MKYILIVIVSTVLISCGNKQYSSRVSGTVTNVGTQEVMPNVEVTLYAQDNYFRVLDSKTVKTDSNGKFSIELTSEGQQLLSIDMADLSIFSAQNLVEEMGVISVPGGEDLEDLDVKVSAASKAQLNFSHNEELSNFINILIDLFRQDGGVANPNFPFPGTHLSQPANTSAASSIKCSNIVVGDMEYIFQARIFGPDNETSVADTVIVDTFSVPSFEEASFFYNFELK